MPKTIGILGGMGPDATAAFFQRIIDWTPARRDQEHIPVIMVSDPRIPDRSRYLLGRSAESPGPYLVRLAQLLERSGADLIAIPCNTAHWFWNEIARSVRVPVLHIVDESLRVVEREFPEARRLGLLATTATARCGIYAEPAQVAGYELLLPSDGEQETLQAIIDGVKAGDDYGPLRSALETVIAAMGERGVEVVIYGCTELGLLQADPGPVGVVDSNDALARAAVEQALLAAAPAQSGAAVP
ncbi:MAG: aspartate racemase [Acidobacteriota bacterium]